MPIAPSSRYSDTARKPRTGPRTQPARSTPNVWRVIGTPAPPTGMPPIRVQAAISAANAAISARSVAVDRPRALVVGAVAAGVSAMAMMILALLFFGLHLNAGQVNGVQVRVR